MSSPKSTKLVYVVDILVIFLAAYAAAQLDWHRDKYF